MTQRITIHVQSEQYEHSGSYDEYGNPIVTVEGDFYYTIEDIVQYVQVEFAGTAQVGPTYYARGRLYTYIDPGFDLKVGDLVDVPTKYEDHNIAIVRELGPGKASLAPFVVKEVGARFYRESLPPKLEFEFSQVMTPEDLALWFGEETEDPDAYVCGVGPNCECCGGGGC